MYNRALQYYRLLYHSAEPPVAASTEAFARYVVTLSQKSKFGGTNTYM
jgi:hypothetical protein